MSELIVVGVDGSAEATAGLDLRRDGRCPRRGARVRVVAVSQMPEYWAVPSGDPLLGVDRSSRSTS